MYKSENHVPIVEVSKGARVPDFPVKASGDRLQRPGARAARADGEKVPQSDVPRQENPGQASGDRLHSSKCPGTGRRVA